MFDRDTTKEQMMDVLSKMDRNELKRYAHRQGVRLYTTVPSKMREVICNVIYSRLHHGDAFWR